MTAKTKPAGGGIPRAGSDHYAPEKHSTVTPIRLARDRRFGELHDAMIRLAEACFRRGDRKWAREWLALLRRETEGRR